MKDLVGNTLEVGDVIALATRYGNSGKMVLRIVDDVEGDNVKMRNPETGRCGWSGAYKNILKLEYFTEADVIAVNS